MNDKDRELVEHVLNAAGTAGQQGFAYMVRFQYLDGLTGLFWCMVLMAAIVWAARRLAAWQCPPDDAIGRGLGYFGLGIAFVICVIMAQASTIQMLAPEGSAIHAVVHR